MIQTHKPRWTHAAVYAFPAILSALFAFLYVGMQMVGLYGGDAGDLTTNAYIFGIPHPPGYPLYTLLTGIISHMVTINSVEWRVCFMSSLPTAIGLFFLWRSCFRLTGSAIAATVSTVLYGLTGPVWLNAITQEAFGLFGMFTNIWVERYLTWQEEKKVSQLFFLAFWTGLALTHHQLIILCVVPAFFIVVRRFHDLRNQMMTHWWKLACFGCLGLLPYIYIPLVARLGLPFDQENASTITGFIRLVTRASYGSFHASANLMPTLIDRMLNIFTFFQFALRDLGVVACVILIIGIIVLRDRNRDIYDYLLDTLFLWIFYFFYAGFPQLLNYQIGTLERFFVVPYQILIIFCSVGLAYVMAHIGRQTTWHRAIRVLLIGFCCAVVFCAALPHIRSNFRAFRFLKTDHSMETLAHDILASAPKGSILFLSEDTTSYGMYDALYVHHLRPDIHFIRLQLLGLPHYRAYLRTAYPDLYVPPETLGASMTGLVTDFLTKNIGRFPIMSDQVQTQMYGLWLPYGLLYSYFPDADGTIDYAPLFEANKQLWDTFSLPETLMSYQKELPMLSDVVRVYSQHRVNMANMAVLSHKPIGDIIPEVQESLRLGINVVPEYYLPPVSLLLSDKRCADAKTVLGVLSKFWGDDKAILRQYVSWQKSCGVDAEVDSKATLFRKQFPKESDLLTQ